MNLKSTVQINNSKETGQMKQSEVHYRQNDNSPGFRTNQPSLNDKTEQRIVMLYTSGQSIELITREVRRARHRVVHILQASGVFGTCQTEREKCGIESPIVEKQEEEFPVTGSGPEIPTERPSKRLIRRAKSPRKATEEPVPTPPAVEKPHTPLSPAALDALCKVAMQSNLHPGKSLAEVRKTVRCQA